MNQTLSEAWEKLKQENPKLRIKNAADQLGVSELELLATTCNGDTVVRLKKDLEGLFKSLENLGYVMALTRNESVVHEKKGEYHKISFNGHVGLVLDPRIDLRIFPKRIGFAFAVPVENARGTMHSIQFFDEFGTAVHKVYLMNDEHLDDYKQIREEFRHPDQTNEIEVKQGEPKPAYKTSEAIDEEGLLKEWAELKDTHDFYPLIRNYKVNRTHALRIAEGKFTQKVDNSAAASMLEKAAKQEVPIMVFVSSRGVIQIHSGPVQKIKRMNDWLNVLDPEFNLHLKENDIAHSWIVEKPTEDGIVTSLELFDEEGNNIVTFFGARKPGKPELQSWRNLVAELRSEGELV